MDMAQIQSLADGIMTYVADQMTPLAAADQAALNQELYNRFYVALPVPVQQIIQQ